MILKKGRERVYGAFWRDESEGINTFFNNLKIRNKFSTILYFHIIYTYTYNANMCKYI